MCTEAAGKGPRVEEEEEEEEEVRRDVVAELAWMLFLRVMVKGVTVSVWYGEKKNCVLMMMMMLT